MENEQGDISVDLILGKSRLAPIKQLSIPRLELSAAVVACKLKDMIKEVMDLNIESFTFWTDSTIVLGYIRNVSKRFKTFVANRLSLIHEKSEVGQWRHVPGSLNPADLASRGINAEDDTKLKVWINGPEFLLLGWGEWPTSNTTMAYVPEDDVEVKVNVNVIAVNIGLEEVWNSTSSYTKLKTTIAWLLRFKEYCKSHYLNRSQMVKTGNLSVDELQSAEKVLLNAVQVEVFNSEIENLKKEKSVNLISPLVKLCPVLEEGLLRVGGRLETSILDHQVKHPIILPSKHAVTKLIILECHEQKGHAGLNTVLATLRQRYWIIRGIGAVKGVIHKCFNCKRRLATPCTQRMAQLPPERLTPDKPPFTFVGVDYFGPILVKVGRAQCKRYGCLFTCLTTRAVHVEIAHSLDTDSFLCAFRRFTSRRGSPKKVFSDNGTNFVSG